MMNEKRRRRRARLARRAEEVLRGKDRQVLDASKPPIWSRWHILSKVSPSGKTMFVCLICGREDIAPRRECTPFKSGINSPSATTLPINVNCHKLEEHINTERSLRFDRIKQLYLAEFTLKGLKLCEFCIGWGCNVCGGIGGK